MARTLACRAGDPGSIPGRGVKNIFVNFEIKEKKYFPPRMAKYFKSERKSFDRKNRKFYQSFAKQETYQMKEKPWFSHGSMKRGGFFYLIK